MDKVSVNKPKVLLVDNDKGIVNFLKLKLKISGYDATCCSTGEECLEHTPKIKPDIILLDVNLPGIDGVETLKRLREFSSIPVVILSGKHSITDEFTAAGASAFVRKPFDLEELVAQIKTLLQQA